jgi:hypothetical protein
MRTPFHRSCAGIALALLLIVPAARAGGARIVDAPGLPPFTNLQEAVDAAADGDTILVAGGTYAGFAIHDKSLQVVAVQSQNVFIDGTVQVVGLSAQRSVVLSSLKVTAHPSPGLSDAALVVSTSQGHVRLETCHFNGGPGAPSQPQFGFGGHGVVLQASSQVAFDNCFITGGDGSGDNGACSGCIGGDGGHGVRSNLSTSAYYECGITGGNGGSSGARGGLGGSGLWLGNTWSFSSGSTYKGGDGGNGLNPGLAFGGDGGSGLFVNTLATAQLFDNAYAGGAGGASSSSSANNGQPGSGIGGSGNAVQHAGTSHDLRTNKMLFDGSPLMLSAIGNPGEPVWVRMSTQPMFRYQDGLPGVHLVANAHVPLHFVGLVPANGELIAVLPTPKLVGVAKRVFYMQGFGFDFSGKQWLGCPMHTVLLDREALPDCNGNQQSDLADVFLGTSADCGPNLVPDECDPDCDANGVPDDCDIGSGTHEDCNANGIPDPCDLASGFSRDCNLNGVPDECDIANGTSLDANGNGIPDECEG